MGTCSYQYNPSEQYQRTPPGCAPETCCGARTYPLADEPELRYVQVFDPETGLTDQLVPTGRLTNREHHDPYCPGHGGSPEPPPPPVSMAELEAAHHAYTVLAARFEKQPAGAIANPVPGPAALEPSAFDKVAAQADMSALDPRDTARYGTAEPAQDPVSEAQLRAAAEHYQRMASQLSGTSEGIG